MQALCFSVVLYLDGLFMTLSPHGKSCPAQILISRCISIRNRLVRTARSGWRPNVELLVHEKEIVRLPCHLKDGSRLCYLFHQETAKDIYFPFVLFVAMYMRALGSFGSADLHVSALLCNFQVMFDCTNKCI